MIFYMKYQARSAFQYYSLFTIHYSFLKDMRNLTLLTDLYQLTMLNAYYQNKQDYEVVFDLFFRENSVINYSVFAGLEQAVDYIKNITFTDDDISYLKSLDLFDAGFLQYLKNFKFTGDIYSVKEGGVVFPDRPIMIVKAPVMEAQFIETALLNIINHQTLIASKAARVCYAAKNDAVLEFGLRRAQGPDAGIYGARAAVIGGCSSTSNVLAAKMFNLKASGTHSHSFVMSFDSELDAFRNYAGIYPDKCLLLVDTYDTLKSGIINAVKVFKELEKKGKRGNGIRLDSGDIAYLSKKCREILDENGLNYIKICASGDLDEKAIQALKNQGAKVDFWGVGTKLITSTDLASLGGVYKLSAVFKNGKEIPKLKISDNAVKITNPCFKKVMRFYDKNAHKALADLIMLKDEKIDESKDLTIYHPVETWKKTVLSNFYAKDTMIKVFDKGKLVYDLPDVETIKDYCKAEMSTFWDEYLRLDQPQIYKVDLSDKLYDIKKALLSGNR